MSRALICFDALSHAGRLAVFRLLVRMAPQGARPTEMAQMLGLKQNTLSHHLAALEQAGLVRSERRGRSIHYSADMGAFSDLMAFIGLDLGRGRADLLVIRTATEKAQSAMEYPVFNVLFICSGNSARSIFAEVLLRDLGGGRFNALSAGTRPAAAPNPFVLDVLTRNGHAVDGLRSKHVSQFQQPDTPIFDFVFTVCDTAAGEDCPPWPGQPVTGHWGLPDPVRAVGTDAERALVFAQTYGALRRRIAAFVALPFDGLDCLALQSRVDRLGLADTVFDPSTGKDT